MLAEVAHGRSMSERYGWTWVARLLSAPDGYEMVRSQGHVLVSIHNGKVLIHRTPASIERS